MVDMPNQRAKNMKFIGAWVPLEVADAVHLWTKKQSSERRACQSDFLVEAFKEKLDAEGIPIMGQPFRSGVEHRDHSMNDSTKPAPLATPLAKPVTYKPAPKKRKRKA